MLIQLSQPSSVSGPTPYDVLILGMLKAMRLGIDLGIADLKWALAAEGQVTAYHYDNLTYFSAGRTHQERVKQPATAQYLQKQAPLGAP